MSEPGWSVVVPVKRLREAKSRLRGAVSRHRELVLAMAQDTVAAARACPRVRQVVVVTRDPAVAAAVRPIGVCVVADRPGDGLNGAIVRGQAAVAGAPVVVIAADLPALRPAELAAALGAAADGGARAFVPDAAGTGTTLLAAGTGTMLQPRFGPGSAALHAASGARRLDGDWPSLRRDVDTAADLLAAVALGVGAHTGALTGDLPPAADPTASGGATRR